MLHKLRYIAHTYYLIDEEETDVEKVFREDENKALRDLYPIISWTNERAVVPIDILEYQIKKLMESEVKYGET